MFSPREFNRMCDRITRSLVRGKSPEQREALRHRLAAITAAMKARDAKREQERADGGGGDG